MECRPHVTVCAVVERDGCYLMVEELIEGRAVFNQPAGHLDEDESLHDAVVREMLEETGWGFEPEQLVGVYLWKAASGRTFLRVAFHGRLLDHDPARPLDDGILRTLWLSRAELAADPARLRTPLVLRCIDDHRAGRRHPLDLLAHLGTTG